MSTMPGPERAPIVAVSETIDPATAPCVCPQRFARGTCRCCADVGRLRGERDLAEAELVTVRSALQESVRSGVELNRQRGEAREALGALMTQVAESADEIKRLRGLMREALDEWADAGTRSEINPDARGEDIARIRTAAGL